MRGKTPWFVLSIDFHKFQVFGRDQDGRYQASSYGELRVSISRWNNMNSIIWNNGRSVFQCKTLNKNFIIETLMKEMKPIVMGNKGGWVWMSRKIIDRFFLEILDYPGSHTTNKINGFSPQNSSASVLCYVLNWLHDGGIRTLVAKE